jgi:hypothetical protein
LVYLISYYIYTADNFYLFFFSLDCHPELAGPARLGPDFHTSHERTGAHSGQRLCRRVGRRSKLKALAHLRTFSSSFCNAHIVTPENSNIQGRKRNHSSSKRNRGIHYESPTNFVHCVDIAETMNSARRIVRSNVFRNMRTRKFSTPMSPEENVAAIRKTAVGMFWY